MTGPPVSTALELLAVLAPPAVVTGAGVIALGRLWLRYRTETTARDPAPDLTPGPDSGGNETRFPEEAMSGQARRRAARQERDSR